MNVSGVIFSPSRAKETKKQKKKNKTTDLRLIGTRLTPRLNAEILYRVEGSLLPRPQSLAITFWEIFELIIGEKNCESTVRLRLSLCATTLPPSGTSAT